MPSEAPNTGKVSPLRSPDGSLLGWLARNYPDTYTKIITQPREVNKAVQYRDSHYARKRPSRSGRVP